MPYPCVPSAGHLSLRWQRTKRIVSIPSVPYSVSSTKHPSSEGGTLHCSRLVASASNPPTFHLLSLLVHLTTPFFLRLSTYSSCIRLRTLHPFSPVCVTHHSQVHANSTSPNRSTFPHVHPVTETKPLVRLISLFVPFFSHCNKLYSCDFLSPSTLMLRFLPNISVISPTYYFAEFCYFELWLSSFLPPPPSDFLGKFDAMTTTR